MNDWQDIDEPAYKPTVMRYFLLWLGSTALLAVFVAGVTINGTQYLVPAIATQAVFGTAITPDSIIIGSVILGMVGFGFRSSYTNCPKCGTRTRKREPRGKDDLIIFRCEDCRFRLHTGATGYM